MIFHLRLSHLELLALAQTLGERSTGTLEVQQLRWYASYEYTGPRKTVVLMCKIFFVCQRYVAIYNMYIYIYHISNVCTMYNLRYCISHTESARRKWPQTFTILLRWWPQQFDRGRSVAASSLSWQQGFKWLGFLHCKVCFWRLVGNLGVQNTIYIILRHFFDTHSNLLQLNMDWRIDWLGTSHVRKEYF